MAKRLIWTSRADSIFSSILEYYISKTGSKTYSRKLNQEIAGITRLIQKQPYIGHPSEYESIRYLIHNNYKIFYEVTEYETVIHLVWDSRQSPDNLSLFFK